MAITASDLNTLRMTSAGIIPASVWNKLIDAVLSFRMIPTATYGVNTSIQGTWLDIKAAVAAIANAWNFKVYDASSGGTLQVRVNSGDTFAGMINGQPAMLNGGVITTPVAPAVAPLLATPSSGFIYIKVYLNPDGTMNKGGGQGTGVDILWSATSPLQLDSATPPTYATQVIAQNTVSGQTQTVDNNTNYGFTSFFICGTLSQFS